MRKHEDFGKLQDPRGNLYAIVRYSRDARRKYNCKEHEALWWDEYLEELCSFGGSPGLRITDFATLDEAREFLLTDINHCKDNPDFWLEILKV